MNTGELLQACREMLNDLAPPYGWDDAQLVRYLNNAVGEACLRARLLKDDVSTRPDLCVYPVVAGESLVRLRPEVIVVRRGPLARERLRVDDPKGAPVVDVPNIEELKHWVGHEAYLTADGERNDPAASALHLQLFENRFGARPTLHEMARWADSPPRVRYAPMY